MMAAPAPRTGEPPLTLSVQRTDPQTLRLDATPGPGARTLVLHLKSSSATQIEAINDAPVQAAVSPTGWTKVYWQTAGRPVSVTLRAADGSSRLDVRYSVSHDRWPMTAKPLPQRPADVMGWQDSDSTVVVGTRAFDW